MYEKSIELFNKAVADEMSAVHQYMFFHFHCEDQGYSLLSVLFEKTAIEEMIHVERCAERILFLGGEVEMVASMAVQKIHDVKGMLDLARKMEMDSIRDIYAFPKSGKGKDLMMSAPSTVAEKQLKELHIAVTLPKNNAN